MRTENALVAILGDCCARCGRLLDPGEPTRFPVCGSTMSGQIVTELTCVPCAEPLPRRVRLGLRAAAFSPAVLAGYLCYAWWGWLAVIGVAAGAVSGVYAAKWLAGQVRR